MILVLQLFPFTESKDNMATTYEKIASTTLGSNAASISFTSIAASWTDLRLIFVGRSDDYASIRYNNDGASNYSFTTLYGTGSAAGSNRYTSQTEWYPYVPNSMDTTIPSLMEIDIFSYAGSTYKTGLSNTSLDKNGSGFTTHMVGLWRSTSAITRLDILALYGSGQFLTGTTATLYGILKA